MPPDPVNDPEVTFFKQRYSAMSDDELIFVLAARQDQLTEEARFALAEVAKARNLAADHMEVVATARDLESQAEAEKEREAKHAAHLALQRTVLLGACAVLGAGGVFAAVLLGEKDGLAVSAVAVGAAVLYEVRRLVAMLLRAMFRN